MSGLIPSPEYRIARLEGDLEALMNMWRATDNLIAQLVVQLRELKDKIEALDKELHAPPRATRL